MSKYAQEAAAHFQAIYDYAYDELIEIKDRRITAAWVSQVRQLLALRDRIRDECPVVAEDRGVRDYLRISSIFNKLDAWDESLNIEKHGGTVTRHIDGTLTARIHNCRVKWSLERILVNGNEIVRDLFNSFLALDVRPALTTHL